MKLYVKEDSQNIEDRASSKRVTFPNAEDNGAPKQRIKAMLKKRGSMWESMKKGSRTAHAFLKSPS